MERGRGEHSCTQADYWSVCLSDQTWYLIAAVCPILLNSVFNYFLHKCAPYMVYMCVPVVLRWDDPLGSFKLERPKIQTREWKKGPWIWVQILKGHMVQIRNWRTNVITSGSWVSEHTVVFLSWTLSLISPRRGRRLGHMCCPCSCGHCLCLGGVCKGHVLLSVFICSWSAQSALWVCMFGWGWECLIPLEFIHSLSTGWNWKKGKWQPHI